MKTKVILSAVLMLLFITIEASAQKKKDKAKEPAKTTQALTLQTEIDSISYIIGHDIGKNLKGSEIKINYDVFNAAVKNGYEGNDSVLSPAVTEQVMMKFQQDMMAKREEKTNQELTFEKAKGAAFLEENKTKPGVTELPSGLQYKVITEGTGAMPAATDTVEVHYTGKLIDGTVFDSSVQRGETIKFPVNGVITGWTEGLQLMKEGAKYEFYIPSTLAYGDRSVGPIPGGSTLVFEVELISVAKE